MLQKRNRKELCFQAGVKVTGRVYREETKMKSWLGWGWLAGLSVLCVTVAGAAAPVEAVGVADEVDTVEGVRFADQGGSERAVMDLGSGGIVGDISPRFTSVREAGGWILRVRLPSVKRTSTTGGVGLGEAISRYYVVGSGGGGMFVDFHLARPPEDIDVFALDNPARIVLDVTPGEGAITPRPTTGAATVVTEPRAGKSLGRGGVRVTGYGRPFEARGVWRVKGPGGKVARQGSYATADWATTWGAFGFTATYPSSLSGKSGVLQVGAVSAGNGRFRGVSVPVVFE